MKTLLKVLSYTGLALTILPCIFLISGVIDIQTSKTLMLTGTVLWFATAVIWIKKDKVSL